MDMNGLGRLGTMLDQYRALVGNGTPLAAPKKRVVICCADHGVAAEGVSAFPQSTTVQMTANYLVSRGAVANAMANFARADLQVVDLGIAADTTSIPGLLQRKVAFGTQNFAAGPAMTREQAQAAIDAGRGLVDDAVSEGYRCFLPGEMGIANTTSSACIAAAICGLTPEQATGRGTNISDARLIHKIDVVHRALAINHPDASDGLDVLAKVGGFELGALAGLMLGAAERRCLVILDGLNTASAALIAQRINPNVTKNLLATHVGGETAHPAALRALGLSPFMDLRLRLSEATGSAIAANLLDAAIAMHNGPVGMTKTQGICFDDTVPAVSERDLTDPLPPLSTSARQACQERIDHLSKPLNSLGRIEEIAAQLASFADVPRPPLNLSRHTLLLDEGVRDEAHVRNMRHLTAMRQRTNMEATVVRIADLSEAEALDFGFTMAQETDAPLLAFALTSPLSDVSRNALLGAMFGAVRTHSLVVLDNADTEAVAGLAVRTNPSLEPYLLHVQPRLLRLGVEAPGITACCGTLLVDAALHMLNDMKTFAETDVPTAQDGPGAPSPKKF